MKRYFLFQHHVGDFEVTEAVFLNFISFIDSKSSKCHYHLVTMFDDPGPDITYYYVWSRSSDFTYLGYVKES